MSTEQKRTDFEESMSCQGEWPQAIERTPDGGYKLAQTAAAWEVWQSAWDAALQSQDREDAERYLWLKDQCKKSTGGLVVCRVKNWELEPWSCDHLDQDIDRARSAKGDLK